MRLTTKKSYLYKEVITVKETFECRLNIKKGVTVSILVDSEDGEFQDYKGKTEKDEEVIDSLTRTEQDYIGVFLEGITWVA